MKTDSFSSSIADQMDAVNLSLIAKVGVPALLAQQRCSPWKKMPVLNVRDHLLLT